MNRFKYEQDQVNNANSAFILINCLISRGYQGRSIGQSGSIGQGGPGVPDGPGGSVGPVGPCGPGGPGVRVFGVVTSQGGPVVQVVSLMICI